MGDMMGMGQQAPKPVEEVKIETPAAQEVRNLLVGFEWEDFFWGSRKPNLT